MLGGAVVPRFAIADPILTESVQGLCRTVLLLLAKLDGNLLVISMHGKSAAVIGYAYIQ